MLVLDTQRKINRYTLTRNLFSLLLVVVFGFVLHRVYIERDYLLSQEMECDPSTESCFTRLCEEDCEEEKEYYKIRMISARFVDTCDPHFGECPELVCGDTPTCSETLCASDSVSDGEWCTGPNQDIRDESLSPPSQDSLEISEAKVNEE